MKTLPTTAGLCENTRCVGFPYVDSTVTASVLGEFPMGIVGGVAVQGLKIVATGEGIVPEKGGLGYDTVVIDQLVAYRDGALVLVEREPGLWTEAVVDRGGAS